jgi:formamidopyrimidine-DNA glycosylase
MPELPDVEVFKQYLDSTALHQKIQKVQVFSRQVLNTSSQKLSRSLKGQKLIGSRRLGKFLMIETDNGRWLVLHFGMTGGLKYYDEDQEKPEHERMRLNFSNGYHLGYDCQRMLGEIDVTEEPDEYLEERDFGPDAGEISLEQFRELIHNRRGSIKSALMNQKAVSGIGNVYSDEILYQSKIHPRRKTSELSGSEIKKIYKKMQYVFGKAVECQAQRKNMPKTWLIEHRSEDHDCPRCGGQIKKIQITGRNAYLCPQCQS